MTSFSADAKEVAHAIREVARGARSEEDLRIGVEHVLAGVRQQLGVTPRYERPYSSALSIFGGGSSDAVYGHAVIEYKRPQRLSRPRDIREATEELKKYLVGEAAREGGETSKALRRIIGIALDGENIFFLRYRGSSTRHVALADPLPGTQLSLFATGTDEHGFQRDGPYPITEETIARFLLYLRALRRRPLTPEALADEFGPRGNVAAQVVRVLHDDLFTALKASRCQHPKVRTLFAEWDRIFGIVYGQDIARAAVDARALAHLYRLEGDEDLKILLFAIHAYFALLMKLIAAELASLQSGSLMTSPLRDLPSLPSSDLQQKMAEFEEGGLFARLGIRNFLEGDFFRWYLSMWDDNLADTIRTMIQTLSEYEPATGHIRPEITRDLSKELYHLLIPRDIRHDLGEYYTPDWLAELTLNELGYNGDPARRLLDPACGSGTFLVLAIQRAVPLRRGASPFATGSYHKDPLQTSLDSTSIPLR